jgi:hypothetical protein
MKPIMVRLISMQWPAVLVSRLNLVVLREEPNQQGWEYFTLLAESWREKIFLKNTVLLRELKARPLSFRYFDEYIKISMPLFLFKFRDSVMSVISPLNTLSMKEELN